MGIRSSYSLLIFASIIIIAALLVSNSSFAQNLKSPSDVSPITLVGEVNVASLMISEKVAVQATQATRVPFMSKDSSSVDFSKISRPSEQSSRSIQASPPQSSQQEEILAPQVSTGFEGLSEIESGFFFPPDVQIAAGPNHLVEMVNSLERIWTKQGVLIGSLSLSAFFLTPEEDPFDPKIFFDTQSGRWFASATTFSNNVKIAVSTTNDPTGNWVVYTINYGVIFPDQPRIGASDDKFVVSTNLFIGNSFFGAHFFLLDKSQMLAGIPLTNFNEFGPDASSFSIKPVQSLSSTSPLYLVSIDDVVDNTVTLWTITGNPPVASLQTTDLGISAAFPPPPADQAGTANPIDTGDIRILDARWFEGDLWFTLTDQCFLIGDATARSCVHLVEIDTSSSTVTQDFRLGAAGFYYFYPAISIDASGGLGVVFGFSNAAIFPSIAVTGRQVTDPLNTVENPIAIKVGTDFNPTDRYGDYFGAATDPSFPNKIWVAGQYHQLPTWSTWINSFTLIDPTIKITKNATNADGAFSFTISNATNPSNSTIVSIPNTAANNMTSPISLIPGSYNVTEIVPAGWTLDASNCLINGVPQNTTLNINVTAGDSAECIFVDTFVIPPPQPTIKITKNATNADGAFSFTISNATNPSNSTIVSIPNTAANNMTSPISLIPGSYNVTETVPAGWTLDASNCLINGVPQNTTLNFNITLGDAVECIFENTKQAGTRLVSTTGTDSGDCIASPCKTIQFAIDQAVDGDTIQVSSGTYPEKLTILSRNNLMIQGAGATNTIIQGDHTFSQVRIQSSTGITISDLTIRDGGDSSSNEGGAVQVFGINPSSSVVLQNLILTSNEAVNGGAIEVQDGELKIVNGLLFDNEAANGAGAILVRSSILVTIESTTIVENTANFLAGGIIVEGGAQLTVRNSIFWDNNLQQIDTTFGGVSTVSFSDIQGGHVGVANINHDMPNFVTKFSLLQ